MKFSFQFIMTDLKLNNPQVASSQCPGPHKVDMTNCASGSHSLELSTHQPRPSRGDRSSTEGSGRKSLIKRHLMSFRLLLFLSEALPSGAAWSMGLPAHPGSVLSASLSLTQSRAPRKISRLSGTDFICKWLPVLSWRGKYKKVRSSLSGSQTLAVNSHSFKKLLKRVTSLWF